VTPAALLGALAVLVTLSGYAALCALAPFGACRCHGTERLCRRCDGTGLRVRAGRRLHTYLRGLYIEGTRPERRRP